MNIIAYCTCPDDASAADLAEALVERGLAACVSRLPGVISTYRWQGDICNDNEVLLLIKTTSAGFPALEAAVLELHPYEVPELIGVPIEHGHQAYLAWLAASVQTRPGNETGPKQS